MATKPTLGTSFDPRHNSLNFLRLILASAVIFSHGISLGGYGTENIIHKTTLGTVAVYGFFGISGYLIAGSASHVKAIRYLWQRFLRIFPAFWVCLIVTAFGFGLVAWFHGQHHGGVSSYLREPGGPLGYLGHNFWLRMDQQDILGTLRGVPYFPIWNGSLWTLSFEFLCYLLVGLLALIGLLKHRWTIVGLVAGVWVAEIVIASVPDLNVHFDYLHNPDVAKLLVLVPVFLAGSLLFLYRDRVPDSRLLALGSGLVFLAGLVIPLGNSVPAYTLTSMDLTAIFLAYPMLWLGIHLPFNRVERATTTPMVCTSMHFRSNSCSPSGGPIVGAIGRSPC